MVIPKDLEQFCHYNLQASLEHEFCCVFYIAEGKGAD